MKLNINSPLYVIVYAAVVSAVFTAGIMTLGAATSAEVQRKEEMLRRKALVEILLTGEGKPLSTAQFREASDREVVALFDRCIIIRRLPVPGSSGQMEVAVGYALDTRVYPPGPANPPIGYALPISGVGFWANISGYLAVTPDLSRTLGVAFLQHAETPGLGGRITEDDFRRQFVGLTVTAPAAGGKFIYVTRQEPAGPADPRYGRSVDAITGATGTSLAVEKFLNADIERFRRVAAAAGLIAASATQPEEARTGRQ